MKLLQNKEFKKLKSNVMVSIVEQVKQFTARFDQQLDEAEQKINKLIIQRLQQINDKFDMLDEKDKEYFLEKLDQKEIRDNNKMRNP